MKNSIGTWKSASLWLALHSRNPDGTQNQDRHHRHRGRGRASDLLARRGGPMAGSNPQLRSGRVRCLRLHSAPQAGCHACRGNRHLLGSGRARHLRFLGAHQRASVRVQARRQRSARRSRLATRTPDVRELELRRDGRRKSPESSSAGSYIRGRGFHWTQPENANRISCQQRPAGLARARGPASAGTSSSSLRSSPASAAEA